MPPVDVAEAASSKVPGSASRLTSLIVPLTAILIVSAVLQFVQLGEKSLWADEVPAVGLSSQRDLGAVFEAYRKSDQRQPPLYLVLLHGWIRLAGSGDAAVRVPSSILAIGSVALFGWLAYRLAGLRVALLAAYLLAVSPFLLLFGRMARNYTLGLFLALLSTASLVEALRLSAARARSWTLWTLYGLASLAMLLANYGNAAVLISQGVFVTLLLLSDRRVLPSGAAEPWTDSGEGRPDLRRVRNRWLAAQAAVLVAFGLWLAVDWSRTAAFAGIGSRSFDVHGWQGLALPVVYPLYAFALGETIFPWHPLALIGGVVVVIAALLGLIRLRQLSAWGWLPVLGFAGTLIISIAAYHFWVRDHSFETLPSRSIAALPFLLLIVAVGLASLRRALFALTLAGLTATYALGGWNYFTGRQFHNPIYAVPTREIASMVLAEAGPTDLVAADYDMNVDYYWPAPAPKLVRAQDEESVKTSLAAGESERLWLITLGRDGTRGTEPAELESWLSQNFRLVKSWGFVPQDPTYSRIKERIQGFPDYRYKATVRLFEL